MFETNTASCGGFPGVSDAFASALWGVDYAMQLAHSNFSGALFHAGGQNVSYNVRDVVLVSGVARVADNVDTCSSPSPVRSRADSGWSTDVLTSTTLHSGADERVVDPPMDRGPDLLLSHCSCRGPRDVEHLAGQGPRVEQWQRLHPWLCSV